MEPLDPELRDLVAAERGGVEPSQADRERVARSLSTRLGVGLGLGAGLLSTQAAGAAGTGAGLALKLVAALVVAGAAAIVIPRATQPAEPARAKPVQPARAPSTVTPPVASAAAPDVAGAAPRVEPEPRAPERVRASSAVPSAPPPLGEEARLLKRAQQALRDGQPRAALVALAEHQRRFPSGQLSLERSAARLNALCALGRTPEVEREARAFLEQYPGSRLSAQVRSSCGLATPER